jgi:hypothetical protein
VIQIGAMFRAASPSERESFGAATMPLLERAIGVDLSTRIAQQIDEA